MYNQNEIQPEVMHRQLSTPTEGRLGVLIPGMGAVATTFIAGVLAIRRGLGKPIGALSQMGTMSMGSAALERMGPIRDMVSLARLDDLVFGGWDIFPDNVYDAALKAGVLERRLLDQIEAPLSAIEPMTAVFDNHYVKKLDGPHVKQGSSKMDLAEALMSVL